MKEEISQRSSVSRNVTEKKKSIKNMGKYSSCRISNIFIVISKINEENSIYLVSLYYSFSTKCRAISMQEPGISSDSKFFSLFLIIRKVSVASDCRQLYECKKSNENIWEYFKRRLETRLSSFSIILSAVFPDVLFTFLFS